MSHASFYMPTPNLYDYSPNYFPQTSSHSSQGFHDTGDLTYPPFSDLYSPMADGDHLEDFNFDLYPSQETSYSPYSTSSYTPPSRPKSPPQARHRESHLFNCKEEDCTYATNRQYDMTRHVSAKHKDKEELLQKGRLYDCPHSTCHLKGVHGFARRDHLREHCKRVHQHKLKLVADSSGKKWYPMPKESKRR